MVFSYEERAQEQTARWKLLVRLMLYVVVIGVGLVATVCFYVVQPLWGRVVRQSGPAVAPERLEAHVRMLAETLAPRDYGHPDNLERAAAYIRGEFEQARGRVTEQPFKSEGWTYRNVIARFGPETRERIVVGAHYDAFGPYPAADDNASGVAGLIELAYLLGRENLPVGVELVAYTLEEPPYFRTGEMGSAVHAQSLKAAQVAVRAMFSLEMIGYFSDAPDSQQFPVPLLSFFYPSRGNFVAVVGNVGEGLLVRRVKRAMSGASDLPVYSINGPRFVPGLDFSDHLNYWQAGYRAVMITDTAFLRNPHYHTVKDTPDRLDYRRMAQVVTGVNAAVLDLAR